MLHLVLGVLLFLGGCGDDGSAEPDAATGDTGPRLDAGGDAVGGEDAGTPCVELAAGATITADTLLCAGTVTAALAEGQAAFTIDADAVTLTCEGTVIDGGGEYGTVAMPTVGIRITARSNVTVRGCTVRGFRYGVTANGARDITLDALTLDDNFHDPAAGWVQDTVQGGGIRLEAVTGGSVTGSSFARTWNGIELRGTRGVTVQDNVADHCSNTGATLVDAHDNVIADNDFSWAIRGDGLSFPAAWYGIDTRDSAGIIVDAGSSGNRITGNDFRYGGDGVFIRSVIGRCAIDNHVEGNDTSFSPHNAIECWCDGNAFIDNTASDSHYGIWLGGTDRGIVRGNTVERSVVDGISIQIGEDRHTVIEDNRIAMSGRAGLLLTGREYQAWHDLGFWADRLANSSHLVLQRNDFDANGAADIFITSTRGVVLASNCAAGGREPMVRGLREAELLATVGSCGGAEGRTPPNAALTAPGRATPGTAITLDASGSAPSPAGGTLTFHWLVQRAATRFESLALPPVVLGGEGPAMPSVTFTEPGLYDVDVTVSDGALAALAHHGIAVVPAGREIGAAPAAWTHDCLMSSTCTVSFAEDADGIDGPSVRATADAAFGFRAVAPATRDLGADLTSSTTLAMFVRGRNDNPGGWQGNFPVVVLGGPGGDIRYEPAAAILPTDPSEWIYVEVPLAGGGGWTRTDRGAGLAAIDWVAIEADTWDFRPVDVWVDALAIY